MNLVRKFGVYHETQLLDFLKILLPWNVILRGIYKGFKRIALIEKWRLRHSFHYDVASSPSPPPPPPSIA